ncbi:Aste57867_25522 [Aphanomyces stellatus]|uniref:Aste57867_25522 protein n=1 Tax=Aphanomyces stellatus TaxID=120398 RepID=A0A485LUB5_9STRA|nr:hypothetical protein As57867_025443 [Aphanomyces stellatus]VFU02145.1 Aste57867_25522 [Aphanomyces stellatus]
MGGGPSVHQNEEVNRQRCEALAAIGKEFSAKGKNVVVIVTPHHAAGDFEHTTRLIEGILPVDIYYADRDKEFAVYNVGDGGFINWYCIGCNWTRFGSLCHYTPISEDTPFSPNTQHGMNEYHRQDWFDKNQRGRTGGHDHVIEDIKAGKHNDLISKYI